MFNHFIFYEGLPNGVDENLDDYVIFHKHFDEPEKSRYTSLKRQLPCVKFFGKFLPPVSSMTLNGNGIVVLDIDLKAAWKVSGILEAQMDLADSQLFNHFQHHPSIIFYYNTTSRVGFHIGYLTNAKTDTQSATLSLTFINLRY